MVTRMMRDAAEVMRDEMVVRDNIAAFVAAGPKTIPEIAEYLGYPRREVMLWAMAMWKYGTLKDTGETDEDGYPLYAISD